MIAIRTVCVLVDNHREGGSRNPVETNPLKLLHNHWRFAEIDSLPKKQVLVNIRPPQTAYPFFAGPFVEHVGWWSWFALWHPLSDDFALSKFTLELEGLGERHH